MKPHKILERIDFILVSFELQQHINISDILPSYLSDHAMPYINVRLIDSDDRGPGYWKFNTTLLSNQDYITEVKEIIDEVSSEITNITLKWEIIKMKVRGFSIKYSSRKKKSNMNKL